MLIGDRLRELREVKRLSQSVIEQRTGLLRCYISRVENGHTVPAIETLEKMANALEVPMYQLFYDGDEPPKVPQAAKSKDPDWTQAGEGSRYFARLRRSVAKMSDNDRTLLLHLVNKLVMGRGPGATRAAKRQESAKE